MCSEDTTKFNNWPGTSRNGYCQGNTTVLLGSFRDDRVVREQFLSAVPGPGA